jgi:hypothetical protein
VNEQTNDRAVLAAVERLLRDREHVSADEVLADLRWSAERKVPLMRAMKLLIDVGDVDGKPLTGDGTILDVMATGITEKGLDRLGLNE